MAKARRRRVARRRPWLYVAGPLFSEGELEFNRRLSNRLGRYFRVYLPQRDGILLASVARSTRSHQRIPKAAGDIFRADVAAIRNSDVLLIVLDGRAVDEGAAFELGFAHAVGLNCYGLQTDPRRLLPYGNNPMISGALIRVFASLDELTTWASAFRKRH
jgi:nucleoside 2-deoxyribosyltransferase